MASKLFVGKIQYSATEKELTDLFSQAGNVVSVAVIIDKFTGRSRGFAFVEMSSDEEAKAAIEKFNNYNMGGMNIVVNEARPQEARSGNDRWDNNNRGNSRSGGNRRFSDRPRNR